MAIAHERKYTYDDYAKLPDEPRMELIRGRFLMSPAPNIEHQRILRRLFMKLTDWVEKHFLGEVFFAPTDVVLSRHDVVQPDILFVSRKRENIIGELNVRAAPDVAVEIVSPGSGSRDRMLKKSVYEEFGVREYWIVDPKHKTITVMGFEKQKLQTQKSYGVEDLLSSKFFPGLEIKILELFGERDKR